MGPDTGEGADPATLAFYDRTAPDYADYAVREGRGPWLDAFAARLAPGAAILDLGSGPGWAAAAFRDLGFAVTAMDASPALAEEGRRRYGLPVRVARFDQLADIAAYDGVWASFSLLHARRAQMPANLARIARALRPGGILYLGLKEGTGEARDRLGRFYSYFTEPELRDMLGHAGFAVEAIDTGEGDSYDGTPTRFLHIHARLA